MKDLGMASAVIRSRNGRGRQWHQTVSHTSNPIMARGQELLYSRYRSIHQDWEEPPGWQKIGMMCSLLPNSGGHRAVRYLASSHTGFVACNAYHAKHRIGAFELTHSPVPAPAAGRMQGEIPEYPNSSPV